MTQTPVVAVGAIARQRDDLLLIRRKYGPGAGEWSIPGGRVKTGEPLAAAVVRELHEETGLEGVCGAFVGWGERITAEHHFVILDFEVELLDDSDPIAGDDASEARWVAVYDVAELRLVDGLAEFLHDHDIIPTIV